MSEVEIAWPAADAFAPMAKGLPKAAKTPAAPVACGVSDKGQATLSFDPALAAQLGWAIGTKVNLDAMETEDALFVRIWAFSGGSRVIKGPMTPRKDGSVGRCALPLGRCGGVDLAARRSSAAAFRIDTSAAHHVLLVQIPKLVDAEEGEAPSGEREAEDEDDDASGGAPLDFAGACEIALTAAIAAWPHDIDRRQEAPRGVRVAAAVALVEFGEAETDVKRRLSLEDMLLPAREEMPANTGRCALAALEALNAAESGD